MKAKLALNEKSRITTSARSKCNKSAGAEGTRQQERYDIGDESLIAKRSPGLFEGTLK